MLGEMRSSRMPGQGPFPRNGGHLCLNLAVFALFLGHSLASTTKAPFCDAPQRGFPRTASDNQLMSTSATTSPKTRGRKPDANSTSGKIRTLLASGMQPGDIAEKLGCSPSLISNVKARMAGGGQKGKRGPGRPPKSRAPAAAMDGLAGIVDMVKKSEAERERLHGALTRVAAILREVLA
ncbi:MAG: hypothetical protein ACK5UQ_10475 [Planctomycetota bacterium]